MKKWIVTVLILLILGTLSTYIFIPGKIVVGQYSSFATNRAGLYRNIFEQSTWGKWWPGDKTDSAKHVFRYHDFTYQIKDKKLSSLEMSIKNGDLDYASSLTMIAPTNDSVTLQWRGEYTNSFNPIRRIQIYQKSKQLKKEMQELMDTIARYFSITENIYDYRIEKASVVDSNLVFTSSVCKGYPTVPFIYAMVDQLKAFIRAGNAKETGFPMLNVNTADSINYLVRVAIPVDRKMEASGNISYKWMLGGGNILITEIKGGTREINKAFQQVEYYVADHLRNAPAIPFLSLVTDRRAEPDSSKWITRIYYPVM